MGFLPHVALMVAVAALLCAAGVSAGAAPEAAGVWRVALDAGAWTALPDEVRAAERPVRLQRFDGPAAPAAPSPEPAFAARPAGGAVAFEVVGRPPSRRSMRWSCPLDARDLAGYPYYLLRYRVRGQARSHTPLAVVAVAGKDAAGKAVTQPLLDAAHVYDDGAWHTVVGKHAPALTAGALQVQVLTEDSLGVVDLAAVEFHQALPSVPVALAAGVSPQQTSTTAPAGGAARTRDARFEGLDLSALCNDTCAAAFGRVLEGQGMVTDGSPSLGGPDLDAGGIPFRLATAGSDIVRPAEDASVDAQPVEFLGVKTTRHYVRPPARDDIIVVPVGRRVSEAFLLLIAELPKGGGRYALPPAPRDYADIGALAVELRYAEGEPDFAFPYSLADGGYALQRMAGAYAVPVDYGRTLKEVVLHNRLWGKTFSLAAVTVNTAGSRVFPPLAEERAPVRVPQVRRPASRVPYVRREGDRLRLGNTFYEVVLECGRGFCLEGITNRHSALRTSPFALSPSSGLEVELGDLLLTGRAFRTESIAVAGNTVTVALRSTVPAVPLALTVRLAVDDTPQVKMAVAVTNTGAAPLSPTVRFPVLRGVRLGSPEDTWVYFPGYRIANTNRPGLFIANNDRSFCAQFVDLYNPAAGAGLAVLTHDREGAPMAYSVGKSAEGASAFVQHPGEHCALAPGETARFTETCLLFHAGDWRQAMAAYQEWLKGWYRPVHAQDKEWFRRLFLMRVHLTKKAYSWAIPIYDPGKRTYRVDEFMKADEEYLSMPPEIVHLGGWCDYGSEHGGDFLGGDYAVRDYTGGPEALFTAVRGFQEKHGIPVSLYMIPDRCSKASEVGKRLGERLACRRADGSLVHDEKNWYVCPAAKEWQDHYVDAVRRTQRETGVKAIYVDVFGYAMGHRCWSKEHGHEVPARPNPASLALIRRIREALPADVAVWSEYPVNDVTAQYLDGNIHYYCLYWHEYFGRRRDGDGRPPQSAPFAQSATRFLFPHLRQFIFLCGSDNWSSDLKFPFFNGEPLYDISWFLYAGPHLEQMKKALALQREYADCFASDNPEPDVPTESAGVHANRFPGAGRTIWTLYNARYTTVRGPVLAVPHRAGATYTDLWNGRPLKPRIAGGKAVVSVTLGPQGLGCVLQE